MNRTINMNGSGSYYEKVDSLAQHYYAPNTNRLPESISYEQWNELLGFLNAFVSQPGTQPSAPTSVALTRQLAAVRTVDRERGWERIREYLGDAANAVTVITPLAAYAAAHSAAFSTWIQQLFH